MKKNFARIISVVLCAVLLVSALVIPTSAATYKSASNSVSSAYKSSQYYTRLGNVPLTGDGRADVLAVALSQLGYQESNNGNYAGNGGGSGNYTEYNYNMGAIGSYSYEWCATFVSWSLYQSGCTTHNTQNAWCRNHTSDSSYIWREVGCWWWANQLRTFGYFQKSKAATGNTYAPQPGDLIFFCWEGPTGSEDHIGIVVYSDDSYVYTVEGNTSNQNGLESDGGGVYFKKYSLSYNYITGYGVLPYKDNGVDIDYSGANPTTGLYMSTSANKYVYANENDTTATWYLPRFSMFEVIGIASNGRLKANLTTTTGETVTGYLLNNEDRLIQITSSAPSVDKSALSGLISGAANASPKNYNATNLENLRVAYDAAVSVHNAASSTQEQIDAAATSLRNALGMTSAKNVLSTGKSYTSNCTVTGSYADDGVRLTNGVKGTLDGGSAAYVSFGETGEIVVDLGSVQKVDTFSAYFAAGMWNIYAPSDVCVDIYVSSDNNTFVKAASSSAEIVTNGSNVYDKANWTNYVITATADGQVDARYVKFVIDNNDSVNEKNVWIDEVEVACYTGEHIANSIYISGMNKTVTAGSAVLFTPAYNSGVISAETTSANIAWTQNLVAKKNSDGSYTVKSNEVGTGDATKSYTLASDEILIAAHSWETGVDNPVGDSAFNYNKLASLAVGTTIYLSGISVEYGFHNIAAYVSADEVEAPELSGGIESNVPQLSGGKTFWLTHYNNNTIEGAGVIFTEAYTGASWWLHVAFAPTDVENVYEIVAISDGTSDGSGVAQTIPEGGFVYGLNLGNDYPTINGSGIDYTSPNCNSALADAKTWRVGDKLQISGLNLTAKTIPTSTPSVMWYDDAYVCTANYVLCNTYDEDFSVDTNVYDNMLWLTHFNDLTAEGAGSVVTNSNVSGSGWNNYYAFVPVGDGSFELVELSIGIGLGTSVMPSIPEGGFVYSINPGNNYPALYASDPDTYSWCSSLPNYTSANCDAMIEAVSNWAVGDTFVFGNLDLNRGSIPTSTSGVNWYDDGYVCTATFEPAIVVEDPSSEAPSVDVSDDTSDDSGEDEDIYAVGDVDGNGEVDQFDYLMVKRAYFDTYTLTAEEEKRADIDKSGTVDQIDYLYIKRIYFNTYSV